MRPFAKSLFEDTSNYVKIELMRKTKFFLYFTLYYILSFVKKITFSQIYLAKLKKIRYNKGDIYRDYVLRMYIFFCFCFLRTRRFCF